MPKAHRYRPHMPHNLWPVRNASRSGAISTAFTKRWMRLGLELLASIALFLNLPANYFANATRDGNSVLRLLHYPPTPPNPDGVRAEAHEDINTITLLLGAEEAGFAAADARRRMA